MGACLRLALALRCTAANNPAEAGGFRVGDPRREGGLGDADAAVLGRLGEGGGHGRLRRVQHGRLEARRRPRPGC